MLARVQAVVLALAFAAGVSAQLQSECPRTVTDYYSTTTTGVYPCCTTTTTLDQVTTYTPTSWVVVHSTTSIAARALEPRESPCTLPTVTTSEVSTQYGPDPSYTWTVTAYTSTVTATPPVTSTITY